MMSTSKMAETTNTRMGSLTSMTHKNTAPMSVDRRIANTIWSASSMLAYSHRLLYRWKAARTPTLINARMPSMK